MTGTRRRRRVKRVSAWERETEEELARWSGLRPGVINPLRRSGLSFERMSALTDEELLAIWHFGPKLLTELRVVVPAPVTRGPVFLAPMVPVAMEERRAVGDGLEC
jgi:hypothetical protein